jgi:hypothetical protein
VAVVDPRVEFNVTGTEEAVPIGAVPGKVAFDVGVERKLPTRSLSMLEKSGPVVVALKLAVGVTLAGAVTVRLAGGEITADPPVDKLIALAPEVVTFRTSETGAVPESVVDAFALGDGVRLARGGIVALAEGGISPLPDATENTLVSLEGESTPVPVETVPFELGIGVKLGTGVTRLSVVFREAVATPVPDGREITRVSLVEVPLSVEIEPFELAVGDKLGTRFSVPFKEGVATPVPEGRENTGVTTLSVKTEPFELAVGVKLGAGVVAFTEGAATPVPEGREILRVSLVNENMPLSVGISVVFAEAVATPLPEATENTPISLGVVELPVST